MQRDDWLKEHDAIKKRCLELQCSYRTESEDALYLLDKTPYTDQFSICERAYTLGRQEYAIRHDLAEALEDRRLLGRYDVSDQIQLHAPRIADQFLLSRKGTTVPTPWRSDIVRLKELRQHLGLAKPSRIGNGG